MTKYLQADLSKLPENSRFPIVHLVITPDVLFGKDGRKLSGITFLKKLLNLHEYGLKDDHGFSDTEKLLVKVSVVACENPEGTLEFLENLEKSGFEKYFDRSLFEVCFISDTEYARKEELPFIFEILKADLFLSGDDELVRIVLEEGFAAATTFSKRHQQINEERPCIIAVDFDGVVGDSFSDEFYTEHGLVAYNQHEIDKRDELMNSGPLANFIKKIMLLRSLFPKDPSLSPIHLVVNTVRGSIRQIRVLKTLQAMGIFPDRYFGTCGQDKGPLLHADGANIFFDDSSRNVESALKNGVFAVHVPFCKKNKKRSESESTPKPCQKTIKVIKKCCEEATQKPKKIRDVEHFDSSFEFTHTVSCACDECLEKDQLSKQDNQSQTLRCEEGCTLFNVKTKYTCQKCGQPSEKYGKNDQLRQKACEKCKSFITVSGSLYCNVCGKTDDKKLMNYKFYCHECKIRVQNRPNGKIICLECNREFIDSV